MRILIIGGTGLISTATTRELAARGHQVTVYNRGQRQVQVPEGVQVMHGDRRQFATFEAQMQAAPRFDSVIDMICFRPDEAESDIRAFAGRTDQLILCSTVDVYTKPATSYPIREDAPRQPSPSFDYAYQKAACERMLEAANQRGDFALTVLRPAHTYGEGARPLNAMGFGSYIIDRMRKGLPIIVHGDGKSLWASCHRDDVGRALANAAGNSRAYGQAYHVASEEWLTWDRYHQLLAEAAGGPPPKLVHIPADLLAEALPKTGLWTRENFQYPNIFDNAKARRDLDFRPTIPFREGAARMIAALDVAGAVDDCSQMPIYDQTLARWAELSRSMVNALAPLDS